MTEFAQAPCTLIFDKFVRVYFSCRPLPDKNRQYVSYSAYVDLNRYDLSEILDIAQNPILELGELGTFDEFGTYPVSVIRRGEAVLAYYGGWTRCESDPIYGRNRGGRKSRRREAVSRNSAKAPSYQPTYTIPLS